MTRDMTGPSHHFLFFALLDFGGVPFLGVATGFTDPSDFL